MQAAAAAVGRSDARFFRVPGAVLRSLAWIGDAGHQFGGHNMLGSEKLRELRFEDWSVPPDQQFNAPQWVPRFDLPSGFAHAAAWYRERSEEHTSELQSLMRISYAVFCL